MSSSSQTDAGSAKSRSDSTSRRHSGGDDNGRLSGPEGRRDPESAGGAPAQRKPRIGDSRPAPAPSAEASGVGASGVGASGVGARPAGGGSRGGSRSGGRRRRRGGRGSGSRGAAQHKPVEALTPGEPLELDPETLARRKGRARKGRPVGRYLMAIHVTADATHVAVLEGRALVEYYVSRPANDTTEIYGNIYLGRVQNVLPGMEAAFVDIGTPKNAIMYRGDVQFDLEDLERSGRPQIGQALKVGQRVLCQVTKNPIAHKGARLTQQVSLAGRYVVLVPNSDAYGISKRLSERERRRLRRVLDGVKPAEHGVIVRTAAEGVTPEEIRQDVTRLASQWDQIGALAKRSKAPALLYREPDVALRVIREEFTTDYRSVLIDDADLFASVSNYVESVAPALAERVSFYDRSKENLALFERYHVRSQLRKAVDRTVWLPSGGSLVIEHTEAMTVIDVNTGRNVGSTSLEATILGNNLEAAAEIPRQLRLRDIGGIIVIDFVDMESKSNRQKVMGALRDALAQGKTHARVSDISALGLVEMSRKRIGEGLLESLSRACDDCDGWGIHLDEALLGGPNAGDSV
ncbi:MAG: Rne/Rng family ribonuclease [bacterium]|nr:Rne/Rng family ribonuclease [bacterium]MDE0668975.1 Rne/Rng family ribonuclease [bacterium]